MQLTVKILDIVNFLFDIVFSTTLTLINGDSSVASRLVLACQHI